MWDPGNSDCHVYHIYSTMSGVVDLRDGEGLDQFDAFRGLVVVHFWAPWSQPCKQMNEALDELAKEYENVKFVTVGVSWGQLKNTIARSGCTSVDPKVEAENFPEISLKYEVVAVPTFIFLKGGKVVDRVNGAHVPDLTKKTALHSLPLHTPPPPPSQPPAKEDIKDRLKKLVSTAPCMVFMKGTPQEPRCGFSRQMVAILNELGVEYSSFNILADQEVRQALKTFSNWPTYPQLYANGELVGGLDIVKEMRESGELESLLPKTQSLDARLKSLTIQAPVMVFMKGSPEQPRCGFSKAICELLKASNVKFRTFDILQDEEVRQGLKKFSNWPTYPQLYAQGELIGGLDIVRELKESGELLVSLGISD